MRASLKRETILFRERQGIDIETFYTRYGPMVLRRCRKLLGDEQAAYDAMQEVFLKVLSHRERLTGDYPSALLFRIATNTCLNKLRDDHKRASWSESSVLRAFAPAPEAAVSAGIVLDRLFESGREQERQIAIMYFVDGMTLKEIGAVVKLSTSGVHKRLLRLRRSIRPEGGCR
jgi:RNA polymerase sigma-70 factor (ECF subfamily)